MASVGSHKNGSNQSLIDKAPWTDEQGIGVKIYQGVLVAIDVITMVVKIYAAWFYGLYRFCVPPEQKSVSGEVILITGAGHGMGKEMALRFARLGGKVVCVDINPSTNKSTTEEIKGNKGKAFAYECDVTNRAAVNEMAEKIRKEVGDVTMLVNNAGIMPCKPLLETTEKEIRTLYDVNCLSHLWLLQAFLPSMMKKNHGHIVAMSSMAGMLGLRNLVPYCGSKFAVRGIMESLNEELREDPRDFSGIKFTTVYPYIVDTGLCKNPQIKFPSLMKIVTPQEAADQIVAAVRREYVEITIPDFLYYVNAHCRLYPRNCSLHLKDFLGSSLDSQ